MQEKYREKDKKLYMCFMDLEKAFDKVPKSNAMGTKKKGLQEILVKVVMSLYKDLKTKVKVRSEFSEQFYVAVVVYQGSILSPLVFTIVVDVVTENAREGLMKEVLYTDELVLMSEMMESLKERFKSGELHWRARN